jgi:rSAM/selenodomain-associated transferase 2
VTLPSISIVVPVLNEEARIVERLAALRKLDGIHEVIVVDGGSHDRTRDLVAAQGCCRLLTAPRGRALQMNAGAAVATGSVLLLLHLDVKLPRNAAELVRAALSDESVVAGAFRTRTVAEGRPSWAARWLWLADLRSLYTVTPYGDQALFVRRDAFERIGGFPPQPLFEDLEIGRRLRRLGRIRTVASKVEVSGRRFLARPLYYAFMMTLLPALYRAGISPGMLAKAYPDIR